MPRSPRRLVWFVLCAALASCTQVVEFDPDKIRGGNTGGPGGGPGGDASRFDAAVTKPDGGRPDADDPASEAGAQCTQDTQCASDERCCMNECKKTSLALCTDCDMGCNASTADRCSNRACGCGNGPACAEDQFCMAGAVGGVSRCSECRDANDCVGRSDGKLQCFEGSCVRCDPATNAGCSGNAPICNTSTRTCERCSSSPEDSCSGSLVCTASGACGGCANAEEDCTTPTAPICDSSSTQCRACTGAVTDNPECMAQLSKRYCENQRCSDCRPGTDEGCDLASNRPDCRLNGDGQNECQGCSTAAHCENAGARRFCAADSGRCVECRISAECTDSAKPFCDTEDGTCKPCSAVPGGATADSLWCLAETLTRGLCDPASGRCVACLSSSDCGANRPVCDPTTRICRACTMATEATDCPDAANPACAPNGRCVPCRSGGSRSACTTQPNDQCDGNACVDCINDMGCTAPNRCNTSTHTCVGCVNDSQCNDMNACTTDRCQSNTCSNTPMTLPDDGFSCTETRCNMSSGAITHEPNHAMCPADANMCTRERCLGSAGGMAGTGCGSEVTLTCDGGICEPLTGLCVQLPLP
jgi:hypothetical protein